MGTIYVAELMGVFACGMWGAISEHWTGRLCLCVTFGFLAIDITLLMMGF